MFFYGFSLRNVDVVSLLGIIVLNIASDKYLCFQRRRKIRYIYKYIKEPFNNEWVYKSTYHLMITISSFWWK